MTIKTLTNKTFSKAPKPNPCFNPPGQTLFQGDVLSASGAYIKQLCAINLGYPQEAAYKYCEQYGMKLFTVENDQVQKEVLRMTTAALGEFKNNSYEI